MDNKELKWTDHDMARCWCAGMYSTEPKNPCFEQWFDEYKYGKKQHCIKKKLEKSRRK